MTTAANIPLPKLTNTDWGLWIHGAYNNGLLSQKAQTILRVPLIEVKPSRLGNTKDIPQIIFRKINEKEVDKFPPMTCDMVVSTGYYANNSSHFTQTQTRQYTKWKGQVMHFLYETAGLKKVDTRMDYSFNQLLILYFEKVVLKLVKRADTFERFERLNNVRIACGTDGEVNPYKVPNYVTECTIKHKECNEVELPSIIIPEDHEIPDCWDD